MKRMKDQYKYSARANFRQNYPPKRICQECSLPFPNERSLIFTSDSDSESSTSPDSERSDSDSERSERSE